MLSTSFAKPNYKEKTNQEETKSNHEEKFRNLIKKSFKVGEEVEENERK